MYICFYNQSFVIFCRCLNVGSAYTHPHWLYRELGTRTLHMLQTCLDLGQIHTRETPLLLLASARHDARLARFERCFYFHWSVWTSPLISSFRYMKMDRKPKNIKIMLKAYDYSAMFYFSSDVFTLRVSSSVIWPLQRIGIWRFEAAIGTIIIIT